MNFWTQSKKNIFVAGHMGWRSEYPENTMHSFRAAAEIGVDQIETDIRVTKDGELVLIHDATVDRTTDGTGKVIDYTYEELCKFDAGIKRGEERLVELTEWFASCGMEALLLGCTHFPYFKEALAERVSLPLIDPADEMVAMLNG